MAGIRLESVTQLAPAEAPPRALIQSISFAVPNGEFWVLVGPSGCGKSTLLRTIAGLLPLSSGQIFIGDRLVNGVPARQRDVAMVFQNYALYPHMSVAQNLGFGLKMRGLNWAARSQQVSKMAAALDLTPLLARKPSQLSGGQQQRVALGRALVRQPQVFLLDEPLSNLDAQLRDETRAELKQLHRRFGVTTLYVTHDQTEAMTLADQLIVLDKGKIQQIGPPLEVYAQPINTTVAAFLGSPPMNLLTVECRQSRLWLGQQSVALWDANDDGEMTLGIRPEQVQLTGEQGIPLQVTVVEPLGREILVQGQLVGGQMLSLFVGPNQRPQVGSTLSVTLIPPLHVFDPQTGNGVGFADPLP